MSAIFRKLQDDRGQALVELTFVIPLLLLFLFGIIDFGLAFNTANNDTNIANYAVRELAVIGTTQTEQCGSTTETTLWQWALCEAGSSGSGAPLVCIYNKVPQVAGQWTIGDPITVEVISKFNWLSVLTSGDSYVGRISPSSTISASATMRLEDSLSASSQSSDPTQDPFLSQESNCPTTP